MQSLVIVALCALYGRHLKAARRQFPEDIGEKEAARLQGVFVDNILLALDDDAWKDHAEPYRRLIQDGIEDEHTFLAVLVCATMLMEQLDPKNSSIEDRFRELTAQETQLPKNLQVAILNVQETFAFGCRIPDLSAGEEFKEPGRHFQMLTKYWQLYQAILIQQGSSKIGFSPHPLIRFIVSLKDRIETYLKWLNDPNLSSVFQDIIGVPVNSDLTDLWEEWTQPRIEAVSIAIEEARLKILNRQFDLTEPERFFIELTETSIAQHKAETSKHWQRLLKKIDAEVNRKNEKERSLTCFESVREVEQTFRNLIRKEYERQHGSHWFEQLKKSMAEGAFDVACATMRKRGQSNQDEILHYCQLSDLAGPINNDWNLFQKFLRSRKEFNTLFSLVLKGRTEEAHNRPDHLWPEIERQRVRVACNDLLTYVRAAED